MRAVALSSALVLAAVPLAAGCGKDEPAPPGPGEVVERYYAAGQDPPARCATLSSRALARFGGPAQCEKRTIPSPGKPPRARIERTSIEGGRACARFQLSGAGKGIAVLVREGGAWKIDRWDSGLEPSVPAALPCALEREDAPE